MWLRKAIEMRRNCQATLDKQSPWVYIHFSNEHNVKELVCSGFREQRGHRKKNS